MSDNLPARRTATTVAVITTAPKREAAPPVNPDSHNWFLLAATTGIFAGSAAWAQMWPVAAGLGVTGVALGVAGFASRRKEVNQ